MNAEWSQLMTPICDEFSHLYNVPMKYLGHLHATGPLFSAELDDVFRCASEMCNRHFDPGIGYFFSTGGPIRGGRTCDCRMPPPVLAIVKVHEDRRTVTYGCLRCGRTEDHAYSPCP